MKPGSNLPSSVEERMSGWVAIQERRMRAPLPVRCGPVITLSRSYGCEAFAVAQRLQELFAEGGGEPWSVFDKALLDKVAQDEGIALALLDDLGDATRSLEAFGFHPRGGITHDELFDKVAAAVLAIARQGNAIIVGRGGAILCRGLDNAFHFRLDASHGWRVESLVRRTGISRAEAEHLMKQESRQREQFIAERLGANVADPAYYDAVFNNERHTARQVAAAIHAYVLSARPVSA
ncbi:cytidylate kinase-like family protein [Mesoterricola silvestris]|uniref:Cytidylate kinase-like family protein n=1 Tax=Mesoterricola silvestris TaxID=2927979 RepID=A0AA48K8X0_9BACT|nr:cytidylate kinase-like family protein [Mesoterricola silvestris]BDU71722.1 hypothetical protein METEAL_08960 [Mesoterricola silvestris]